MVDCVIVIVNWKMCLDIDTCLESLFSDSENDGLSIKAVVVDNSDNCDGISDLLKKKYPDVEYLNAGGNRGFGYSQNLGMRSILGRYYFVLNPDTKFIKGSNVIRKMYDYMEENQDVGIMGPKLLNFDNTLQYSCYRFPRFLDKPIKQLELHERFVFLKKRIESMLMMDYDHEKDRFVDWLMGSALFVRGKAIEDVGLFDDRFFMYLEDCDWCRRMWESYWKVCYVPSIILYHKHRRDSAKIPGLIAIIKNPTTRFHIKSWLQYFWKWKFKPTSYYQEQKNEI